MVRLTKLIGLAGEPAIWSTLLRTGTAAAIEHLPVLRRLRPNSLIDVGANKGQFALAARLVVPDVSIQAFEPLPAEGAVFERNFLGQVGAYLLPFALADVDGQTTFHIADRADSSSLLRLSPVATQAYRLKEAREITVEQRRLDSVVEAAQLQGITLLKIDVQGAEALVLAGATRLLPRIDFIYAELSFVPLYAGQPLAGEIIGQLAQHGYGLRGIHNVSETRAFGPTQADFLFANLKRVGRQFSEETES